MPIFIDLGATLGRCSAVGALMPKWDDVPGGPLPGKITLFGGHREGGETFLECVVREIHEELSFFIPPERFEPVAQRIGPDNEVPGGIVHAGIFVTRDVPVDKLFVTEGRLKIVRVRELGEIAGELTPSALFGLRALSPRSSRKPAGVNRRAACSNFVLCALWFLQTKSNRGSRCAFCSVGYAATRAEYRNQHFVGLAARCAVALNGANVSC